MNFYYNGIWRMDWGLGNPNKTATLIACLILAVWMVALIWNRGFWPALVISTALEWCLVQTYSRGGMVAFLVGMGVLLLWNPRPWPKARWIAVIASLWVLGGFVLYAKAQTRYGQGLFTEDQSVNNRLVIWRHVPEMMAAAPWGWGMGRAGDSYSQWYQPINQSVNYLNLINSHFTWMVEWGWMASVFYLFAWLTVLLISWPSPRFRLKALPLAIWIAFGVGACFSAVAESPWLWIIPLLALGYVLIERYRFHEWPSRHGFIASCILSVGLVSILVLIGLVSPSLPISVKAGTVTIGKAADKTVILVDRKTLGAFYGLTFRKFLAKNLDELANHTFTLAEASSDSLPSIVHDLVVTGRFTENDDVISHFHTQEQVTLVNPACLPEAVKSSLPEKTVVLFGEYSQAPSRSSWSNSAGVKTYQINGASDFIPLWPQAILMPPKA